MAMDANLPASDVNPSSEKGDLQNLANEDSSRRRRKLKFSRKLIVVGALAMGLLLMLASLANVVDRADLTELSGEVRDIETVSYWEDVVLYFHLVGNPERFKYESGYPGFEELNSKLADGCAVKLWVETVSLDMNQPVSILAAEVEGIEVIQFEKTQAARNEESFMILCVGLGFLFLGFWIWHRATRPLPDKQDVAAYEQHLEKLAEKHPRLFITVHIINKIREWGESIPKLGDLFTVFFFFWILPLYMHFIYITAFSFRRLVRAFCLSYWIALAGLSVAALLVPGYPGGDEYPYLGPTGSKLFLTYLMLNLAYGGAMWIWGTLMYEEEEQETKVSTESETAEESRAA